jgi:hypothetical protein
MANFTTIGRCHDRRGKLRYQQELQADLYLWLTNHLRECDEELQLPQVGRPFDGFLVNFLRRHDIPRPDGVS